VRFRLAVWCIAFGGILSGQNAAPSFDAASVKRSGDDRPQIRGGPGTSDPGRITYARVALRFLVMKAWDLKSDELSGPSWAMDVSGPDMYTVTATMPRETTKQQFQAMLQSLLLERFQMKVHHETRDFPGYELVAAPGGSKLKPTTQDPNAPADGPKLPGRNPDRSMKLPPGPYSIYSQGKGVERAQFQVRSTAELAVDAGTLLAIAQGLDTTVPHPRVADKTGLTAKYDFAIEFDCPSCGGIAAAMRANIPMLAGAEGGVSPPAAVDAGSGLPNIFNAFEKQLGLKLVKTASVPVDVLVIDRAEKMPLGN